MVLGPLSVVVLAAIAMALVVVVLRWDDEASPLDAEFAALGWTDGVAQEPRPDGDDEWEVDVVRGDGSLVEVTVGDELELLDLDEELGPEGTRAPDELRGALRARAVRAALAETGSGRVVTVERESPREIEVSIRVGEGRQIEVELDRSFAAVEVEPEDPRDE